MGMRCRIVVYAVICVVSAPSFASVPNSVDSQALMYETPRAGPLLAKAAKPTKRRDRRLSTEREVRTSGGGASTSIDFDATDIAGERKAPLGSLVSQSKSDMDYDFVKIRMQWHPEMVQSAASLESGSR